MRINKNHLRILILLFGVVSIAIVNFDTTAFYLLKPLTTISILAYLIIFNNPSIKKYAKRVGLGLFFCLVGDVFLLFEAYFVFGLASFLIGHMFFLFAFISLQGLQRAPAIITLLVLIAVALFLLISPNLEALFYPVLIYLIVIVLMSWQGWALSLNTQLKNIRFLGLGVSLFLFSDALIAIDTFYITFSFAQRVILISYWAAIYIIAQSATK